MSVVAKKRQNKHLTSPLPRRATTGVEVQDVLSYELLSFVFTGKLVKLIINLGVFISFLSTRIGEDNIMPEVFGDTARRQIIPASRDFITKGMFQHRLCVTFVVHIPHRFTEGSTTELSEF